ILRYGFAPSKVAFLSYCAWRERYPIGEIKRHLRTFLWRFFKTSQFKRSCVPNGPKVGNGGSLSPRGDWRAPSDSEAVVWMEALNAVPDSDVG
ncbi:MAG: NAD(+) synthase, partial [Gammaproteobacteria bacterium]